MQRTPYMPARVLGKDLVQSSHAASIPTGAVMADTAASRVVLLDVMELKLKQTS